VLDAELTQFLESGCSTIIGLITDDGAPYATRGWGTEVVSTDPPVLRAVLGAAAVASLGYAVGDGRTFPIAITGADVLSLRSVQLKGTARDLEPPTEADLERSARFCDAFFADVQQVDGIERWLMDRLVPADLLVVTIDVAEAYDQTPGPGAGAPLTRSTS
jgi:hypothetical protein